MAALVPAGYRLIEVEETASTNAACLEAAKASDPGNLWIRADRQVAGRGSRGRSWVSAPGNLFTSLLLVDPAPVQSLSNLTFVAALAVREALAEVATLHQQSANIALKWPNDVLLSGRKVSGILLESHEIQAESSKRRSVIVGIGVNCVSHPDDTLHDATDLATEGFAIPARDMFALIAASVDNWLKKWDRGNGFLDIRRHWLDHAHGVSEPIHVRFADRQISGIFENIDTMGQLELRCDDGSLVAISTADIFFSQPGSD